jgi:hypothetical protein
MCVTLWSYGGFKVAREHDRAMAVTLWLSGLSPNANAS